ncbi:NADPH-dependent FMN reductase [Nocardioides daeguensis]|uniref:NADPH-dependent FMN reductase-like domain-containing protein n=1 Tax=Nocardioides daeguensis TaxID=908359 RepID=A0ABP6V9M2_9ACTN|nr:NAD(P)H-dependent oxidoreductase [Nocardioides daeguensis]MBV6726278.1 NAD(P)H-dependent oxidoreductase [Nocardioides daeguensis]MCR1772121.1 NAD(P)H-dependent oxidoreductase [Nocardioides daeguensis]
MQWQAFSGLRVPGSMADMTATPQHHAPLRIGLIVGSLSHRSINRRLARALHRMAPSGVTLADIRIDALPMYNPDHDAAFPASARRFKAELEAADGLIIVTPEYNRSIPAVLKNAIDVGSRPWGESSWFGKPVALLGAGLNGAGTAVAQAHLRACLGYCGAQVLGAPETCVHWTDAPVDEDGVAGPELATTLAAFLAATVRHVAKAQSPDDSHLSKV